MVNANLGESKNIIVGAAAFYINDASVDLSGILVAGTSAAESLDGSTAGWKRVGYTENGVTVSYEPTYGDVTVDQLLDSALIFKSGMKVTINTTFAEATLENLVVAWGQADAPEVDAPSGDKVLNIDGGSLGDYPHERSIAFVGPGPRQGLVAPNKSERVYNVTRAIQTQTTAHDLKRDAATTLPASFRCLPANDGTYGKVRDRSYTPAGTPAG